MAKLRGAKRAVEPSKNTTSGDLIQRRDNLWPKGFAPNPSGRPIGARSKFNEAFALDMQRLWADPKYGGMVLLKRVSRRNPEAILRVAVALAPKQIAIDAEQTIYVLSDRPISGDEWAAKYADPAPPTIEARSVDEKVH